MTTKRRAYYVRKPDGILVQDDAGCAIPFDSLKEARKVASAELGIIGYWNWFKGEFQPRKRA